MGTKVIFITIVKHLTARLKHFFPMRFKTHFILLFRFKGVKHQLTIYTCYFTHEYLHLKIAALVIPFFNLLAKTYFIFLIKNF